MKQSVTIAVVVALVLIIGGIVVTRMTPSTSQTATSPPVAKPAQREETGQTGTGGAVQNASARYIDYSPTTYQENADRRRVLFFKASWCPTCNLANQDYTGNLESIPEDTVILKVDYDTESALKQKYAITYQHTFVQVDKDGNEITKWNGGGVDELLANLR